MKQRFLPAYLLTLVNVLGFSILMPVLPFVVESYNGAEWIYGALLTLYAAFQFLGAPFLGALSDYYGRKPILMISQAGTLLSWFVFMLALLIPETGLLGIALPLWVIAASRILDGVTGGNTSVTNAYISDITTREEKSYIFGYMGGIAGIGMIVGPGLGGITASGEIGYLGTLITASIISIITLFTIHFMLKESKPDVRKGQRKRRNFFATILVLRRIRQVNPKPFVKLIFLIRFLFSAMMAFYIATIALFMIDLFDFNERELGTFMLVVGVFLAFNQAFLSKRFIRIMGEVKTLYIGLFLSLAGLICITLTDVLWQYICFYYIMNLGLSLCFPTLNALVSIHAKKENVGEVMGISESLNSLALAIFPVLAAGLYGIIGYELYYFISGIPLIALLILLFYRRMPTEDREIKIN